MEIASSVGRLFGRAKQAADRATGSDRGNYPRSVAVYEANSTTMDFLKQTSSRSVAEIGIYRGHTSLEIAKWLDGEGELHLFDYEDRVAELVRSLGMAGFRNVQGFGSSYKSLDSYNWQLGKLLDRYPDPIYDYVFLDGAHTWAVDALTTFLVDQLLKPDGYLDFDDCDWTLADSPSMRPSVFPRTKKMYTDEQIKSKQVAMIIDRVVRRSGRYREIVPSKIFQKIG